MTQLTSFPIEIILGEDDSTDKTGAICSEYANKYPDKIRLFLRSRKDVIYVGGKPTGKFNFSENLKACKGKYIALCEGDDYWTDPLKLQKQIDFLEANAEYSSCFHNTLELNQKHPEKSTNYSGFKQNVDLLFDNMIVQNHMPTCSVVFRNNVTEHFLPPEFFKSMFGDWYLHLLNSQFGKAYYINEVMGVHRLVETSHWTPMKLETQIEHIITAYDYYKVSFEKHKRKITDAQFNYIKRYFELIKEKKSFEEWKKNIHIVKRYYGYKINKKISSIFYT